MIDEFVAGTLITKFGFPIAVAGVLLWDRIKNKQDNKVLLERNNRLLEEIKAGILDEKRGIPNG